MGPRGHRLHCTKRHFWVLMRSLCQEGKTRERWGEMVVKHGWKLKWQDLHWWHQWGFPPSPCCQVLLLLQSSGSLMLLHPHHQRRTTWAGCSQTRPKQYKLVYPFSMKNMQSLNVCYSQCVTSFFVSVYPVTVGNVFVVCACVHCVKESMCVWMWRIKKVRWGVGTVMWVEFGTLHSEVKVNKGAVNYFIYLLMQQCNWIRGKLTGEGKHHTRSCIGSNSQVTTYVLQDFSILMGNKSFKKCVYVLVKECLCEKWMRTKRQSYFFSIAKIYFCTQHSSIFESTHFI